jgi:hypothetical protein
MAQPAFALTLLGVVWWRLRRQCRRLAQLLARISIERWLKQLHDYSWRMPFYWLMMPALFDTESIT